MGDGDGNTTQMDLSALADAITAAGIHMDYIFFDACLMQTVEGAWALRHGEVKDLGNGGPYGAFIP